MVCHKAHDVDSKPRTKDIILPEDIDFKFMMFSKPLLQGLLKSGYRKPSPIQRKALPLVRCGLDLIVQAKAGTGKTLVLAIAALETVQPQLTHLQAIVLAPTREIAIQVHDVINAVGHYHTGFKCRCFIGGYPLSEDVGRVTGCQVAVGTPGRVSHLLRQGLLDARYIRLFILDEADKLLEDAFVSDINNIYFDLPLSKQVIALSATYTPELIEQLGTYMQDARHCSPDSIRGLSLAQASMLLGVRQFVNVLQDHSNQLARLKLKEKCLVRMLTSIRFDQCFVFSNLHSRAASVCTLLNGAGLRSEWIAGRQEQTRRISALEALRTQRVRVLVTTDLASRGIDAEHVDLIINMDLPNDGQTYLHRMGRAGRYGTYGMVITIVHAGVELEMFQKIVGSVGATSISVSRVPSNLENTNLWTIPTKELKQIYGIIEMPISALQSETVNKECNDELLNLEQHPLDTKLEQHKNRANTKPYFSEENELSGIIPVHNEVICQNFYDVIHPKYNCNISIDNPYFINKIFLPSLFLVSECEYGGRDILPIVINESMIPLNVPITLLGEKVVRVKCLYEKQSDHAHSKDNSITKTVEYELNVDNAKFFAFDEIKQDLVNGVNQDTKNIEVLGFETMINLFGNKPDKWESQRSELKEKISAALTTLNRRKKKIETQLASFDSFDLVGWMAVGETSKVLDSLSIDKCDIYTFQLTTCPDGMKHIKPTIPKHIEANENSGKTGRDLDNFVVGLNLKDSNLNPTLSLNEIAEKIEINERSKYESQRINLKNGHEFETNKYFNGLEFKNKDRSLKSLGNKFLGFNKTEQDASEVNGSAKQKPTSITCNNIYRNYKNINFVRYNPGKHKNNYQDKRQDEYKGEEESGKTFEIEHYNGHKRCSKSCLDKKNNRRKNVVSQRLSKTQQNKTDCSFESGRLKLFIYTLPSDNSSSEEPVSVKDVVICSEKTWRDLHDDDESDTGPSDDISSSPLKHYNANNSSSICSSSSFYSSSYSYNESKLSEINHDKSKRPTDWYSGREVLHKSRGISSKTPYYYFKNARETSKYYKNLPPPHYAFAIPKTNHHPTYQNCKVSEGYTNSDASDFDTRYHGFSSYRIPKDQKTPSYRGSRCEVNGFKMPHTTNHYAGFFSYEIPEDEHSNYEKEADGSTRLLKFNLLHNPHFDCGLPNKRLRSENFARNWYLKWYMQVRERAQQIEITEYNRIMAMPQYW